MKMLSTNPGDRKVLAWILLLLGAVTTLVGLCGVWLQGAFYRGGFPTAATFGEVRSAFTCPAAFTAFGCLTVAGALFGSPITASWSQRQKLVVFLCFGVFVLVACGVCGHLASARVARMLN